MIFNNKYIIYVINILFKMQNKIGIDITKEHDKLCLLEKLLNKDSELESLVSEYIDSIINKDEQLTKQIFIKITNKINDDELVFKIISLSISTANQLPFKILLPDNEKTQLFIKYINQPFILF